MMASAWLPGWSSLAPMANHLWQSTIVAAVAGLLALALRRERARVRYWVWLAASFKFLIPFGALIALGSHANWRMPLAATPQTLTLIQRVSQPYTQMQVNFLFEAGAGPAVGGRNITSMLQTVLEAAWLFGFVACLFVWVLRWRRLAAIVAGASPLENGREVDSLRRLEKSLGMTRSVPLLSSGDALEPGVFGIVKPVLLWPAQIGLHLDQAHVDAIVAHEVCHIRRRDNLAAAIHMFIQACFWFYPLAWWIGARLVDERERACDEEVIELGNAPHVYAQSILKTCRLCVESPLICVAGVTGSDLKSRIVEIMRSEMRRNLSAPRRLLLGSAAGLAIALPIVLGMVGGSSLRAQTASGAPSPAAAERPSFEVASVKPNTSGDRAVRIIMQPGGRLDATNATLRMLVRNAYRVQDFQIVGGPDWMNSDRFDIVAKAGVLDSNGFLPEDQFVAMVRTLLVDRFKLTTHKDTRHLPVFALTVARPDGKIGPQLQKSTFDCESAARRSVLPPGPPPREGTRPTCGMRIGPGVMAAGGVSMSQLANAISSMTNRVVLDRTGLHGGFDVDLSWTPEIPQGRLPLGVELPAIDPDGPSIFTALQEQLGLRLESTNGPVDVLVIEHAEQPTPD
jgi:bla regulator protein blaR1